jgi:Zn-dependent protease with chaperone function
MSTPQASHDRVVLTGISSRAWEHPADRSALVALRGVRGFDQVLRWMSGLLRERSHRLLALASSVQVSERQFAGVNEIFLDAVRTLDAVTPPELFVTQQPLHNAISIGMDRPFVMVTTGMLDLLDDDELRFVLGHELGHVLSGHSTYRTMLTYLLNVSKRAAVLPVGLLGVRALIAALEEWYRKSELSGDRAGLLAGQDAQAALRAHMKSAGGARLDQMDAEAFLDQAREYDRSGDVRDGVLKLLNLEGHSHPFAAVRALELSRWVDSGDYARILGGDYPRRVDDPSVSITDELRSAARSYRDGVTQSADPFLRLVRSVGEEASGIGARVMSRLRTDEAPGPAGEEVVDAEPVDTEPVDTEPLDAEPLDED